MPIYEYYCGDCNVIFNFLSAKIAPEIIPDCPRCASQAMTKYLSSFRVISADSEKQAGVDEKRVEDAFGNLLQRSEKLSDSDGGEVSDLMHSFTNECGMGFTDKMTLFYRKKDQTSFR
jgi:putative FmdB family regulatory protein